MIENIYLYHTNDIHSHFDYLPRIHKEIERRRLGHIERKESMFLFDIGDHLDRFHPLTEATLGKENVKFLNEGRYDAVTIGNNEGITLSHHDLDQLYSEAKFDCLLANLYKMDGTRPNWAQPYQIYETLYGTKIGVIGVTVNYTNFYEPLYWKITDPFEEIKNILPIVKEQSDIIVILSHLGLSEDERMAEEFQDIDIILGAHTHHVLENGKMINDTLVCCTGKYGDHLGVVNIYFDKEKNKIVEKNAALIASKDLPVQEYEEQMKTDLYLKGKELLQSEVCYLPERLEVNWFKENELIQLLCEALTEWCQADCSFVNAGVLLQGLNQGIITEFDIHNICPHPINPCKVTLTGSELKEILVQIKKDEYASLEFIGLGFRGKVMGTMIFDQIEMSGEGSQVQIKIKGEELQPNQTYSLATIDLLTFARFYPQFTRNEKHFYLPEFIRDVLKWKLTKTYPI